MKIETALRTPHVKPPADKASRAIHKQAVELEGVFLRKLIEESKVGQSTGSSGSSGYGSMAVDALATAIGDAGGLGLSRMIEEALKPKTK